MRHYEMTLLVNPEQVDQISMLSQRIQRLIETAGGCVHRFEDWGKRSLCYPIQNLSKAHYLLFNIEIDGETLNELDAQLKYNESVLRHLIIKMGEPVTTPSPLAKGKELRPEEDKDPSPEEGKDHTSQQAVLEEAAEGFSGASEREEIPLEA